MKKILLVVIFSLFILPIVPTGFSAAETAAGPLHIDVLYMNHGPLQSTLEQMRTTFARFNKKIQVSWHDFESRDGKAFMAKKGITTHVPLEIWFNGKDTLTVAGKTVHFFGFPTGAGPAFFQGKWSLKDLEKAVETLTATK